MSVPDEEPKTKSLSPSGSILASWSTTPDIKGAMSDEQKKSLSVWKDKGEPLGNKPREK